MSFTAAPPSASSRGSARSARLVYAKPCGPECSISTRRICSTIRLNLRRLATRIACGRASSLHRLQHSVDSTPHVPKLVTFRVGERSNGRFPQHPHQQRDLGVAAPYSRTIGGKIVSAAIWVRLRRQRVDVLLDGCHVITVCGHASPVWYPPHTWQRKLTV